MVEWMVSINLKHYNRQILIHPNDDKKILVISRDPES